MKKQTIKKRRTDDRKVRAEIRRKDEKRLSREPDYTIADAIMGVPGFERVP